MAFLRMQRGKNAEMQIELGKQQRCNYVLHSKTELSSFELRFTEKYEIMPFRRRVVDFIIEHEISMWFQWLSITLRRAI